MILPLSSKAKTLEDLSGLIRSAHVLPLVRFNANKYQEDKETVLARCLVEFEGKVIVRSSAVYEDGKTTSYAGGFESVLNVKLQKRDLDDAILQVIESYGKKCHFDDEVFVQPMLHEVSMCGVVFTTDMDTGAPYYTINYDTSGSTTSVTSGRGDELKTVIVAKNTPQKDNTKISQLLESCRECEQLFQKSIWTLNLLLWTILFLFYK